MSLYDPVDTWEVPANLLSESIRSMAPDGRRGNEGLVMWLGSTEAGVARITHLATFPDRWITKRPDFLQVASDGMNALANSADALGAFLVGQIHSHPGTYIDLSIPDKRYGIAVPYYLSVVAPYYAQKPTTVWSECGIHMYKRGVGFQKFSAAETAARIQVTHDRVAKSLLIGG